MFSRVRAPSTWTDSSVVPGSEFEQFDANIAHALDVYGGGAYSLQADLAIGGAPGVGWTFDLPTSFFNEFNSWGTAQFIGGVDIYDHLTVVSAASFNDAATFLGLSTFNGNAVFNDRVDFNDQIFFSNDVAFNDIAQFYGDVVVGSGLGTGIFYVNAGAQFNDSVAFNGPVSFAGGGVQILTALTIGVPVSFTLDGRILKRQAIGTNASLTAYSPRNYDHVFFPAGTLTGADVNAKIDDTGAVNGDRMRFSSHDSSGAVVQVLDPSNGVIARIGHASAGDLVWVDVERLLGVWRVMPGGVVP